AVDVILFGLLSTEFRHAGIALWAALATVLARVVSASLNFAINRRRVFQTGGDVHSQARRFVAVAVAQMLLSALLVQGLAPLFPQAAAMLVKLAVDLVLFLANYQVQMRLVFSKPK
ncbi:MAG: GtrA family protein, partial [Atopobiaceae bacterium]|nr:GtrA family protein [Atopobiaceae bacterium]